MGNVKLISSFSVIERMKRFRIQNSNWKYDAIDWIGEAIRLIGLGISSETKTIKLDVINYKAKLPASLEEIDWIEYDGIRLPLGYNNIENGFLSSSENKNPITYLENLELTRLVESLKEQELLYTNNPTQLLLDAILATKEKINDTIKNYSVINKTNNYNGDWYGLEDSSIKTSFQRGKITLRGLFIPVDERGLPLVLDNEEYLNALEWYCVYCLLLQGYSHPTVKSWEQAYDIFDTWLHKAQNNKKMPSIDNLNRFMCSWNSIKKDISQTVIFE